MLPPVPQHLRLNGQNYTFFKIDIELGKVLLSELVFLLVKNAKSHQKYQSRLCFLRISAILCLVFVPLGMIFKLVCCYRPQKIYCWWEASLEAIKYYIWSFRCLIPQKVLWLLYRSWILKMWRVCEVYLYLPSFFIL